MKYNDYEIIDNSIWISKKELKRLLNWNIKLRDSKKPYRVIHSTLDGDRIEFSHFTSMMNGSISILNELLSKFEK